MEMNEHQLEKLIKAVRNNSNLSLWKNSPKLVQLLMAISRMPKNHAPGFDNDRVRNQILDRIAVPQIEPQGVFARLSAFVPYLRVGAGVMASLLIVVSLTLGTAVVALESAPGSAIYPLKKIVENIELRLAPEDQKAALQIKFADNRADELEKVLESQQEGKISQEEASAIIASTVKDLQKTAAAAVTSSKNPTKSNTIANKLADISNKLRAASVKSEGQVRIELEKAVESTQISQEQAIKNLENAGLKLENPPISIDDEIKASGKLTAVTEDSISIGTAKFLLTADTKFVEMEAIDLKAGVIVDVIGKIKDNKSYAVQIKMISEIKTETVESQSTEEPQ